MASTTTTDHQGHRANHSIRRHHCTSIISTNGIRVRNPEVRELECISQDRRFIINRLIIIGVRSVMSIRGWSRCGSMISHSSCRRQVGVGRKILGIRRIGLVSRISFDASKDRLRSRRPLGQVNMAMRKRWDFTYSCTYLGIGGAKAEGSFQPRCMYIWIMSHGRSNKAMDRCQLVSTAYIPRNVIRSTLAAVPSYHLTR